MPIETVLDAEARIPVGVQDRSQDVALRALRIRRQALDLPPPAMRRPHARANHERTQPAHFLKGAPISPRNVRG